MRFGHSPTVTVCCHHILVYPASSDPSSAQLQSDMTESPSTAELNEMTQRANEVVHRLEEYRRLYAENDRKSDGATSLDDHRGPKRPWEDGPEVQGGSPESSRRQQTTAEQDMEIIRSKRATTAAGGSSTAGQPKSKYRKRSVRRLSFYCALGG